jgi:hypothetical protein
MRHHALSADNGFAAQAVMRSVAWKITASIPRVASSKAAGSRRSPASRHPQTVQRLNGQSAATQVVEDDYLARLQQQADSGGAGQDTAADDEDIGAFDIHQD